MRASSATSGSTEADRTALDQTPDPVEVDVRVSRRFGRLVRLDIKGLARRYKAGQDFEKPKYWVISAMTGQQVLMRTINGPARVVRNPVGGPRSDLWDVEITFWVAFSVPEDASSLVVQVTAPKCDVFETTLDLGWGEIEPSDNAGL